MLNKQYVLEWKKSGEYTKVFLTEIMKRKNDIFVYIRDYYRAFMKKKDPEEFPVFNF